MVNEVSALLPGNRKFHRVRRQGESSAEFMGRVWCEIEDKITGRRCGGPTPAGTEVIVWHHSGHPLCRFWRNPFGTAYRSTGNPYTDRWDPLPGYRP